MQVTNFAVGVQNIIKGILIILVLVLSTTYKEKRLTMPLTEITSQCKIKNGGGAVRGKKVKGNHP